MLEDSPVSFFDLGYDPTSDFDGMGAGELGAFYRTFTGAAT